MPTNAEKMAALAEEIPALVVGAATDIAVMIQDGVQRGLGGAPPARIDTGELRAGLDFGVNGPSSHRPPPRQFSPPKTEAQIRKSLKGMKIGDVAIGSVRVPHAVYGVNRGYLAAIVDRVPAAMVSWRPKGEP